MDADLNLVHNKPMLGLLVARLLAMLGASVVSLALATAMNASVAAENTQQQIMNWVSFLCLGLLSGWLMGEPLHRGFRRLYQSLLLTLQQYPPGSVAGALSGLTVGMLLGNLFALPLMIAMHAYSPALPGVISAVVSLIFGPLMAAVFLRMDLFRSASKGHWLAEHRTRRWLLDTSAIMDGRLLTLVEQGLIEGDLAVPDFVVKELHNLADSRQPLRRNRGRLGLQALEEIKHLSPRVTLKVEPAGHLLRAAEVDDKLVELAGLTNTKILTVDYNLARVAGVNGVIAVNLAEVAAALKPLILPGETMHLKIIKLGKENGQGVGYLEDGTMVVVDGGSDLVGEQAWVEVTSIIQTLGGRLVFASQAPSPQPGAPPKAHNTQEV